MRNKRKKWFIYNVRTKLLITISFIIIFILTITVSTFYVYANRFITKQVATINFKNLERYAVGLDKVLDDVYYLGKKIQTQADIIEYIGKHDIVNDLDEKSNIHNQLVKWSEANPYIDSIYIYSDKQYNLMTSYAIQYTKSYRDIDKMPWLTWYEQEDLEGRRFFLLGHVDRLGFIEKNYISIPHPLVDENGDYGGILVMNIDEQVIYDEVLNQIQNNDDARIFLLDPDGYILSADDEDKIHSLFQDLRMRDNKQGYYVDEIDGEKKLVVFSGDISTGYKLVYMIPFDSILLGIGNLRMIAIIFATLGIIFGILILYPILDEFYRPILRLKSAMKTFEAGEFNIRIIEDRNDEFRILYKGFNNMADGVAELIEKTIDQRIKINREKYKTLQTQISPHFIYNTLYSIKCVATLSGDKRTTEMLTAFIHLLYLSTDQRKDLITLEEEISQVKNYVLLQKHRFGDQFNVYYHINPSHMKRIIPKLILQPLIENVLKHGVDLKEGKGKIKIESFETVDGYIIRITDNGHNVNIDRINSLLESGNQGPFNEIGIYNVNKRLQLIYGQNYGLRYTDIKGRGLQVDILIGDEPIENYNSEIENPGEE